MTTTTPRPARKSPAITPGGDGTGHNSSGKARVFRMLVMPVALCALIILLQWRAGAFSAELSGYPDEASHYVSGVLVHDYVAGGLPVKPLSFAARFYLHYPYLAIGHWPPLFYVVEGAWMLLFSPSRISVMLLMAVITTALAFSTFSVARRDFSDGVAAMAAVVLVCQPIVQQYTAMVMLETSLALLSLWAAVFAGRYFDSGRWQDSVWFGGLATLAILTKANGFELALIPPAVLLATRRFGVLRRLSFWLPVCIVAVAGMPWHIGTMHLMLPTFTADSGWAFTSQALVFYSAAEWRALGIGLTLLGLMGIVSRVVLPFRTGCVEGRWAAITALPCVVIIFHSVISGGLEVRYLVTAIAPLVLLACAGANCVARTLSRFGAPAGRGGLVFAAAALIFFGTTFVVAQKHSYGFGQVAERLVSDPDFRNSIVLVSSETNVGEGILVSEVVMRDHALDHVLVRASKVLAFNTWNQALDSNYRPLYPSAHELGECLDEVPVRAVVVDTSPAGKSYAHHQQITELMARRPDRWQMLSGAGAVRLFTARNAGALQPDAALKYLRSNVGSSLQQWPISVRLACDSTSSVSNTIHNSVAVTLPRSGGGE